MFTYVCLGTNDLARATVFYDATLGALGLSRCDVSGELEWEGWVGWGTYADQGRQEVALWLGEPLDGQAATVQVTARWSPCGRHRGTRSTHSMQRHWPMAAHPKAHQDSAHNIIRTFMPPTFAILMAIS